MIFCFYIQVVLLIWKSKFLFNCNFFFSWGLGRGGEKGKGHLFCDGIFVLNCVCVMKQPVRLNIDVNY
jgi:hypothetical protein